MYASCCIPGPLRSRNFAIVDSGVSGARSWRQPPVGRRADGEHRLPYPLFLIFLDVDAGHAEDAAVELDGLVEIGDGDPDVIDALDPDRLDRKRG